MRPFIFLIMFAWPTLAYAGEPCGPDEAISQVAAAKGNRLSSPLSVEEVEKANMVVIRETGQAVPFGYVNDAWLKMKAAMQAGDQIYFLSHSDGRFYVEYHILVRDGCIIRRLRGRIT
jgi:hypothetical protein